ncbi:hypothetical protein [Amycolatopsis sp. NPDC004625]
MSPGGQMLMPIIADADDWLERRDANASRLHVHTELGDPAI